MLPHVEGYLEEIITYEIRELWSLVNVISNSDSYDNKKMA